MPERFSAGFNDAWVWFWSVGLKIAMRSHASGVKKALDGGERKMLRRRGGDERFWAWVWFLGGAWGGGGRQSVCGFVSFSKQDAVFKYGARIWVICNIICCGV